MSNNIKLSIIIVNRNTGKLLIRCLKSIFQNVADFNFEVIVIDNNSKDQSREMLKKQFPKITLIESSKNLGFAKANNLAGQKALGELLLFLNPDTKIKPNALSDLINFLENNPKVAIAGPKILMDDHQIQPYSCGSQYTLGKLIFNKFYNHLESKLKTKPLSVDWVTGAALMIRTSAFKKLNGFDENFFMYLEDQDLCVRAKKSGYKVYVVPSAVIIHYGGKSIQNDWQRKKMYYNSLKYFLRKHSNVFEKPFINLFLKPYEYYKTKN